MKITLSQKVKLQNDPLLHSWSKEYISNEIPQIGCYIEDFLFKDPYEYEVEDVIISDDGNSCTVHLKPYDLEIPNEDLKNYAKAASLHGWKASWEQM